MASPSGPPVPEVIIIDLDDDEPQVLFEVTEKHIKFPNPDIREGNKSYQNRRKHEMLHTEVTILENEFRVRGLNPDDYLKNDSIVTPTPPKPGTETQVPPQPRKEAPKSIESVQQKNSVIIKENEDVQKETETTRDEIEQLKEKYTTDTKNRDDTITANTTTIRELEGKRGAQRLINSIAVSSGTTLGSLIDSPVSQPSSNSNAAKNPRNNVVCSAKSKRTRVFLHEKYPQYFYQTNGGPKPQLVEKILGVKLIFKDSEKKPWNELDKSAQKKLCNKRTYLVHRQRGQVKKGMIVVKPDDLPIPLNPVTIEALYAENKRLGQEADRLRKELGNVRDELSQLHDQYKRDIKAKDLIIAEQDERIEKLKAELLVSMNEETNSPSVEMVDGEILGCHCESPFGATNTDSSSCPTPNVQMNPAEIHIQNVILERAGIDTGIVIKKCPKAVDVKECFFSKDRIQVLPQPVDALPSATKLFLRIEKNSGRARDEAAPKEYSVLRSTLAYHQKKQAVANYVEVKSSEKKKPATPFWIETIKAKKPVRDNEEGPSQPKRQRVDEYLGSPEL